MTNKYCGWRVLYVKSQHEKKIDALLKESKLDSFLPTVSTVRQWSDRKKKVIVPLFPSYVFLNVNSKEEFFTALDIRGVFKYLRVGSQYARLKDEEIYRIKQFLNMDAVSDIKVVKNSPKVGEKMIINYGPLSGLECKVIKKKNANRIFVRINSIRNSISASLPISFLTPISPKTLIK
ncbi:UpxY family transcription antiterminator [Maribacter sp. 2307UL18-2]|uniref:UpxY family transcription antiterminator n=1 Tax=Maribacter sp. 2307UL18-2 TaxID=3386274 RepID=UPI0039BD85A4